MLALGALVSSEPAAAVQVRFVVKRRCTYLGSSIKQLYVGRVVGRLTTLQNCCSLLLASLQCMNAVRRHRCSCIAVSAVFVICFQPPGAVWFIHPAFRVGNSLHLISPVRLLHAAVVTGLPHPCW